MRAAKLIAILSGVHPVVRWNAASGVLPAWLTFARASTATYFDASGILRTAAINAPRFDHDPATFAAKGLLIEEQRTNLLTNSSDFTNGVWVKSDAATNETNILAPDGTNTGTGLKAITTGLVEHRVTETATISATSAWSGCVFVKAVALDWVALSIFNNASVGVRRFFRLTGDGIVGSTDNFNGGIQTAWAIKKLPNGWYRISVTQSSVAATTMSLRVQSANADLSKSYVAADTTTSQIYVWGAQLEAAAFVASYTPTTSAAVTRSADVASVPSVALNGPTILESTDIATGVTSRTAYAAGAFAWPAGIWTRALAIYARGTPMSYVNAHLLVGGPF